MPRDPPLRRADESDAGIRDRGELERGSGFEVMGEVPDVARSETRPLARESRGSGPGEFGPGISSPPSSGGTPGNVACRGVLRNSRTKENPLQPHRALNPGLGPRIGPRVPKRPHPKPIFAGALPYSPPDSWGSAPVDAGRRPGDPLRNTDGGKTRYENGTAPGALAVPRVPRTRSSPVRATRDPRYTPAMESRKSGDRSGDSDLDRPGEPTRRATEPDAGKGPGSTDSSGPRRDATEDPGSTEDGEWIGPYRILEKVGEGGFGEVYAAEQRNPVRRRVALKILKAGLDTEAVLARFEAERQVLALFDHANIAKIFDAGQTPSGRPYFAMEFIAGTPITTYCDRERLSVRDRIGLFVEVCDAVQHAHQRGIIHRDLKPNNILVTLVDGRAIPKVIDFGIAKNQNTPFGEGVVHTQLGQMMGTPAYMSPEQAEMSGLNVDTRSDVYSLGAVLYEVLTGSRPFDFAALPGGMTDFYRVLREVDPERPSARIGSLADDETTQVAARRCVQPDGLRSLLRGELDWITLRAMEKDRGRRYGSPRELADDLVRHLEGRVVQAAPPDWLYRSRKFIRQHLVGVSALMALILTLAAFGILTKRQASRLEAEHEKVLAERERVRIERDRVLLERDRVRIERDRANLEEATARRATQFLVDLFEVAAPDRARGIQVTAREMLDRGAERIGTELHDDPRLRGRMLHTLGGVYLRLGLYGDGEELLENALKVRREHLGELDHQTLATYNELGIVYWRQRRFEDAEAMYRLAFEGRQQTLGEEHRSTLESGGNLALCLGSLGRDSEAEELFLETLERTRRTLGIDHPSALALLNSCGTFYAKLGRFSEAKPILEEVYREKRRVLGEDHPETLTSMYNVGNIAVIEERFEDAEEIYLECLELQERVHGRIHPSTATVLYNLAWLEASRGRRAEGLDWLTQAVDAGWSNAALASPDSGLAPLAGPELDALLIRMEENLEAQRSGD